MKTCGSCNLCCKLLDVVSLAKPAGRWCEHARGGTGCAIHGSHPDDCRAFACGWLQWAELGDDWKPSKARFLIRNEPSQGRLSIDVDAGRPNAWRAAAYYPTIKGWASMIRRREGCVLVHAGDRTTVVFPEEDLDIGAFGRDDELAVGYAKGEGWEQPCVRLARADGTAREWRGARLATRP